MPLGELLRESSLNGYSKRPASSPPGVPILRISAGTSRQEALVDETDHKWVEASRAEREKFRLLAGDLLACRFNGNLHFVGRFSLYTAESGEEQIHPDKRIRFRVDESRCDPAYIRFAMNAQQTREKIEAFCATTAGNIGISATNLKTVPVRLPPLAEQRCIVTKVNQLMALCDDLESKLTQSQSDSERLMEAVVEHTLSGASTISANPRG